MTVVHHVHVFEVFAIRFESGSLSTIEGLMLSRRKFMGRVAEPHLEPLLTVASYFAVGAIQVKVRAAWGSMLGAAPCVARCDHYGIRCNMLKHVVDVVECVGADVITCTLPH